MPKDTYTPSRTAATCPYCAAVVPATLESPALWFGTLTLCCPVCGQSWHEVRDVDGTATRYYDRAAGANPSA